MSITTKARNVADKLFAFTAEQNNISDPSKIFNVTPRVEQTIETKVMQSNAFLSQINNVPVREIKGDILAFNVPSTITKRTRTADSYGSLRRPTDPTALTDRSYELFEVEQDTVISWDKIDMWAHLPDFYQRYRNMVMFAQARDRLLTMWYGQSEAAQTNSTTYPLLQDVNTGFFQYMIDTNPDAVLGWNKTTEAVVPIKIDATHASADFKSINQLAYAMRYDVMDRLYQNRNDTRILMGDELTISENLQLLGSESQELPSERNALERILANTVYGETQRVRVDEFPRRGVFMTAPSNMSRYYQSGSMRRKLSEVDHVHKGIVDYNYVREDYVLEAAEGAVCVHPDAIQFWDGTEWSSASETWAI